MLGGIFDIFNSALDTISSVPQTSSVGGFDFGGLLNDIAGVAVPYGLSAIGQARLSDIDYERKAREAALQRQFMSEYQDRALANALQRAQLSAAASRANAGASAGAQKYVARLGQQNTREQLAQASAQDLGRNILEGGSLNNQSLGAILAALNRGGF